VETIAALWQAAVAGPRREPAYLVREGGAWREVSWTDAGTAVDEIAGGFLALGIEKGDRVAIVGRTRLEWTLCDYALASIGAISVPVYPTGSALECAYILGNSGARAVICEDADQYEKVAPIRAELEALDHIISMEGEPGSAVSLEALRALGRERAGIHPDEVAGCRAAIREDDVLTVIYTSGTTGPPKGCVITQHLYWVMTDMVRRVPGLFGDADRILLFLPLAHNFARLVQHLGVAGGFTLAHCPDIDDVSRSLLEVRPTIFPSVPRLFEKAHAAVRAAFDETAGTKRRLVDWALDVGTRASLLRQEGRQLPRLHAVQLAAADRLVFRKVKARFGGSLRLAVSGGAPLAKEIAEFFHAVDILILEGYGLTECTTASHLNQPGRYRFGTVGLPLPGVEAELAGDGEILLRGPNLFAGYYGDTKATGEVLTADGWLRTGDVGSIDSDGFLTVTDRKKDIIITAGGKNVSPQNVESALKASRFVSQALVVGDRRPYLAALLALDRNEVAREAPSADEVDALIEQAVAEANSGLGRVEQVKRFAILDRDFLAEQGELTPTLKLRRHVCEEHFRAEIDALYAEPSPGGGGES
jgi:long-chain acyl-CoA synthetase